MLTFPDLSVCFLPKQSERSLIVVSRGGMKAPFTKRKRESFSVNFRAPRIHLAKAAKGSDSLTATDLVLSYGAPPTAIG